MTDEQKTEALKDLAREINMGLVDDDECEERLNQIGATEEELEEWI